MMNSKIDNLNKEFESDLEQANDSRAVEALRVKYLGKKGPVQDLMKGLKEASSEERPLLGQAINRLKRDFGHRLEKAAAHCLEREEESRLAQENIDVTLPGRPRFRGKKHIVLQVMDRVIGILRSMGFTVQYGPDIESDYYNFEALNFPDDHPARDEQDTFWLGPELLLRTHTSNTQMRVMENHKPPIRIIAPGKCYRNESITSRSHVFFHQVEGLFIDKGVTFGDLMGTLEAFLQRLLGKDAKVRFRPSYFPFVEPGVEVDVACFLCKGKGCSICKNSGWLEVLGAGMVHPEVLKNGGIDPEEHSGFAWGMGIERLVLLQHSVPDIRLFSENDLRMLSQF